MDVVSAIKIHSLQQRHSPKLFYFIRQGAPGDSVGGIVDPANSIMYELDLGGKYWHVKSETTPLLAKDTKVTAVTYLPKVDRSTDFLDYRNVFITRIHPPLLARLKAALESN